MKRILYFYGGQPWHETEWAGKQLAQFLPKHGAFQLEMSPDLDVFTRLSSGDYAGVVIYATGYKDDLTPPREKGLLDFVSRGGGLVAIHAGGADCFAGNANYVKLLNGVFKWHPHHHEFKLNIVDKDHYLTARMNDFSVFDEMYQLQNFDPARCRVLATTLWQGKPQPMVFVREEGKGRVVHLANGHTREIWAHPDFQKLVVRGVAWSTGSELVKKTIRCGILGYGPNYDMGKFHADAINATPGLTVVAMCDASPDRVEAAKKELPGLKGYFTRLDDMLALNDLDLVVDILPHNLHAPTAIQCLKAGKHVVLEKPFCITVEEANTMVALAREKNRMLSLFHNRRWDADYLTIKDIIARGLIGEVFNIQAFVGGYSHPGFWWRSDKATSGGILYDWGAHFVDWTLNLVPAKLTQISGDLQRRVWTMVTTEDHGQISMRFENGVTASFTISNIAAIGAPKWRILGTLGAIEISSHYKPDEVGLVSFSSGIRQESTVKITIQTNTPACYYRNIADHLIMGEELIVTPEQARRVIGVFEAAQQSAQKGTSLPPPAGCE